MFLVIFLSILGTCWTHPRVSTPLGDIEGFYKTSYDGRNYSSFEGIPFAEPLAGEDRFKDAEPVLPWDGVWQAKNVYTCAQTDYVGQEVYGRENCLYLNVYVPRTEVNCSERLDVIVSIHSGFFKFSSGHMMTRPDYLMDREFILVTFNYRIGVLGFLSTGDQVVPGNIGLKDQVIALRWVQNNINYFGGNPNSVMLSGTSSGAISVDLHYLSPQSKGLFQRGLAQSGIATASWTMQQGARQKSRQVGAFVGCDMPNSQKMIDCMRQRPVEQIVTSLPILYDQFGLPAPPLGPVVEVPNPNAFIAEEPRTLVNKRQVCDAPLIFSAMSNEGLYFSTLYEDKIPFINQNWLTVAKDVLDFNFTIPANQHAATAQKIRNRYGDINFDSFSKVMGDRYLNAHLPTGARDRAAAVTSPIYAYYFNFRGSTSINQALTGGTEINDATHGDDSFYIYTSEFIRPNPDLCPDDLEMRDMFLDMLECYATGAPLRFGGVKWEPVTANTFNMLNITDVDDISMRTIDELTDRQFWDDLGIN